MRASRQSELMAEYNLATACRRLGNSSMVAARHYSMTIDRDGDFQQAKTLRSKRRSRHGCGRAER